MILLASISSAPQETKTSTLFTSRDKFKFLFAQQILLQLTRLLCSLKRLCLSTRLITNEHLYLTNNNNDRNRKLEISNTSDDLYKSPRQHSQPQAKMTRPKAKASSSRRAHRQTLSNGAHLGILLSCVGLLIAFQCSGQMQLAESISNQGSASVVSNSSPITTLKPSSLGQRPKLAPQSVKDAKSRPETDRPKGEFPLNPALKLINVPISSHHLPSIASFDLVRLSLAT